MTVLVLNEQQVSIIKTALDDYQEAGHGYDTIRDSHIAEALIEDIYDQIADNSVTEDDLKASNLKLTI